MTAGHVTAVTDAMVPQRAAAIAGCEQPLVDLALEARPCEVKTAVRRIRDLADPDGADTDPLSGCGPDPRRYLEVCPTIDGLVAGRFLLDQVDGEALLTALEAADTPDTPDPPCTNAAATANAAPTRSAASSTPRWPVAACRRCRPANPKSC